ncbi:MAG: cell filamentation protein Fic [Clostridia bacterium]|jgi:hypothetical protein|nr:cell filamentation protein Fic [Clostridia bacterium]
MDIYKRIDLYKSQIEKCKPFEGEMLKQIRDYYRIGLTWSFDVL